MDYIITYDREKFEKEGIKPSAVKKLIQQYENEVAGQIGTNVDYYQGKHAIQERTREAGVPNNKTVCNHAKDISDTASGYFMGNPIVYKTGEEGQEEALTKLTDALTYATCDDDDQENALMLSIAGRAYEYIYAAEGEPNLMVQPLDPANTFIVHDQTIEHKELFGVYYYYKYDDVEKKKDTKTYITVATDKEIIEYVMESDADVEPTSKKSHNMGFVPIVEYKNNKYCIGDFEQQIGLIDAYNVMTADRVNDKESFVDAIMVLYGNTLGDTEDETAEAMEKLKQKKLLELDTDARAEYLTRTFDEGGMETLRQALKEDIYTFSHVPNLTDRNFAGNSSGVAMEYKLLGLEMLTKIKERWYRRGLRKRLQIFCHFLNIKNIGVEEDNIEIVFARSLPKNLLELSQIIANLRQDVSKKTLISLLPFVENPDDEIDAVEKQQEEAIKQQQELFGKTANNEPDNLQEFEKKEKPDDVNE